MYTESSGFHPLNGNGLVGASAFIKELKGYIARIAPTDANVLITGETGTGKELVAGLIHQHGRRRKGPFVCINCAAIPDDLLESELFGCERGAFTGAYAAREGKLKLADRGTVFLDEVGDLSLRAQAKILRVLEERRVDRLGGFSSVPVDVRVISATNQCLEELVAEGKFRLDLFYRLNVVRLRLPPLRERKADVRVLLEHYLDEFQDLAPFGRLVLEPEVREHFERYHWPGNVRELRNCVECLCATAPAKSISFRDLPDPLRAQPGNVVAHTNGGGGAHANGGGAHANGNDQRSRLLAVLAANSWNKTRAAQELRCSRMTLYRKLAKYGIRAAVACSLALLPGPFAVKSSRPAFRSSGFAQHDSTSGKLRGISATV